MTCWVCGRNDPPGGVAACMCNDTLACLFRQGLISDRTMAAARQRETRAAR